jgi:hypothetical protein
VVKLKSPAHWALSIFLGTVHKSHSFSEWRSLRRSVRNKEVNSSPVVQYQIESNSKENGRVRSRIKKYRLHLPK